MRHSEVPLELLGGAVSSSVFIVSAPAILSRREAAGAAGLSWRPVVQQGCSGAAAQSEMDAKHRFYHVMERCCSSVHCGGCAVWFRFSHVLCY